MNAEMLLLSKGVTGWKKDVLVERVNRFNYLIENCTDKSLRNYTLWIGYIAKTALYRILFKLHR